MKMDSKQKPEETCDILLSYVKKSNLNFQLNESPFAATIEIKKSFIKNKDGSARLPCFEEVPRSIRHENQILVALNSALKVSLAEKEVEKEVFTNTIKELEMKIDNLTVMQNVKTERVEKEFFPYYSNWPSFRSETPDYNYETEAVMMNHPFNHAEHHFNQPDQYWPVNLMQPFPPSLEAKPVILPLSNPTSSFTPSRKPGSSPSYTPRGPPPGFEPSHPSTSSSQPPGSTATPPLTPRTPASSHSYTPPGPLPGFKPAYTSPSLAPESTAVSESQPLTPTGQVSGIRSTQMPPILANGSNPYQQLANDIIKFSETKPGENIDHMIFKLGALKTMLKTDKLDDLIENAEGVKSAIAKRKEQNEADDCEDYLVDEYPPHHYGDNGEVLLGDKPDE